MQKQLLHAPGTAWQSYNDTSVQHVPADVAFMTVHELQREVVRARATMRELRQENATTNARYAELTRAYHLTVANLVKATSACARLKRQCDDWRRRAECCSSTSVIDGMAMLSVAEVAAVRKAMARLYHPDIGGDSARMQAWNATLDAFERNAKNGG